jgi:DNA-binding transcriptional ArsR family regulator
MPNIDTLIEEKIISYVRKLSDAEKLAMLLELVKASPKNGHVVGTSVPRPKAAKPSKKGTFIERVEEIANTLEGQFTITDVIAAYEEAGYVFAAQDKNVAVYTALKRLVRRGKFNITKKGIGSKPSYYEAVKTQ